MNTKDTKTDVSVIIPLLNEEESLRELTKQAFDALKESNFELIFVDDGSTDNSWQVIESLKAEFPDKIRGIQFRTNYGKSTALQHGVEIAKGEFIGTMDADLQDDPNEIPVMIQKIKDEDLDLVSGWKKKRHDPLGKTIPSKFFNFVTAKVSGIKLHDFNCGLKVYRSEVIKSVHLHGELHRYIPLLAKWQGYRNIGEHIVQHHARKFGKSKFGLERFIKGFLDLLTLVFLNSYFQRPMHFFGSLGTLFFAFGGGCFLYLVIQRLFHNIWLTNRPLLIIAVMFILLGAQSFSIGLLGEINKSKGINDGVNVKDSI